MACLLTTFACEVSARLVAAVLRPLEQGEPDAALQAQRGAYELLVWALSRLDGDPELYKKGIPSTLRQRLNDAYGEDVTKDRFRWSQIGRAKWSAITPGAKFSNRSARTRPPDAARQQQCEGGQGAYWGGQWEWDAYRGGQWEWMIMQRCVGWQQAESAEGGEELAVGPGEDVRGAFPTEFREMSMQNCTRSGGSRHNKIPLEDDPGQLFVERFPAEFSEMSMQKAVRSGMNEVADAVPGAPFPGPGVDSTGTRPPLARSDAGSTKIWHI